MTEKIALLLESDGPGGAESILLSLATGLRERGLRVHTAVLANRSGWLTSRIKKSDIDLFTPTLSMPLDWKFASELAGWARKNEIDVLHAHEFTMGFYAGVVSLMTGIPHVITMHGGHGFAGALRRRVALAISARFASAIVGVSESTCEHIARSLWLARDKVQLVTNGVRLTNGDRFRTRALLNVTADEHLFLAVGNLYPVKAHRTLVDACKHLLSLSDLPSWRLVIAGRGSEEQGLQKRINESGLASRVALLGLRDDIGDLLAAADGWVMPSLSEGLPLALLEAMFAEKPVISTAVGGIPDLIRPQESGWLVEPGNAQSLADAMISQLRNPTVAARYATRGRLLVQQGYGQEIMIDRYLGIYRAALATRSIPS
jgi:glycosyltransferase involved in cell wall biosynthesis